jgi:hypothetical protein
VRADRVPAFDIGAVTRDHAGSMNKSSLPRPRGAALMCASLLGAVLCLSGCASAPTTHLARTGAVLHFPLRVVTLQAPLAVDAGRLQEVFAPKAKPPLADNDPRLVLARQRGEAGAAAAMAAALGREPNLVVIAPAAVQSALDPLRGRGLDIELTPDEALRLHSATGAEVLLRYGITDYGLTPRAWRHGYIVFEVVTTLALAAVIAYSGSKAAQAAATLYLVQETAEESAEAYATFQAFDVVCRPVRIKAQLLALDPRALLWESRDTGLSDIKLGRYFRKVGADERDRQLDQATGAAVRGIAVDLHAALEYSRLRAELHAD